eukprot:m.44407 g.44407  ORF g.44407 m.44407 type:complete len:349 (+) comp19674_c0_seq1:366-1412(+)
MKTNQDIGIHMVVPNEKQTTFLPSTMNVGLIGHVAHGKSTVVKTISGVSTGQHKLEMEKNLTIKLGYANAKLYRGQMPDSRNHHHRVFYDSRGSTSPNTIQTDKGSMEAVRQISFLDCPGHEVLMATMLNGAAVMDAAMLVVAANEEFPQPQTLEHLAAMEIMQLKHLIVLQNKVDIVSRAQAQAQHKRIVSVLKGTIAENAPIIPISAQSNANIDMCIQQLCKIPVPKRDTVSDARMVVVRSFCVNKPNTTPNNLIGGVIGGSLLRGTLRHGQLVELRPGLVIIQNKIQTCKPLVTRIESIFADKDQFETVTPGGLIGIGTHLDPSLSRGDRLIGQILGPVGTLPPI